MTGKGGREYNKKANKNICGDNTSASGGVGLSLHNDRPSVAYELVCGAFARKAAAGPWSTYAFVCTRSGYAYDCIVCECAFAYRAHPFTEPMPILHSYAHY